MISAIDMAPTFQFRGDAVKCAEFLQKFVELRRKLGSRSQVSFQITCNYSTVSEQVHPLTVIAGFVSVSSGLPIIHGLVRIDTT